MSIDTSSGHPAMDYPEHVRTYNGFIKASIILIVFVALVLVYLLTLVP
ncbi:MAG: aa3-type cytochrome c oxidase subunit IV [Hyphomicrobiaceae bacterium]|nr:aa3-type cytochrome c oxidase subunit IV [Hyphomicrobiaceae bacterium]